MIMEPVSQTYVKVYFGTGIEDDLTDTLLEQADSDVAVEADQDDNDRWCCYVKVEKLDGFQYLLNERGLHGLTWIRYPEEALTET